MRVTNQMMVNQFLQNLNGTLTRLSESNAKLSTGKRIQKPSDDPIGVAKALELRTSIQETDQYVKNVNAATSWLDSVDSAFNETSSIMGRVKEIAVSGANGPLDSQTGEALAQEVDQLLKNAIDIANTDTGGRYLFGGFRTTAKPFTTTGTPVTGVTYNGDSNAIKYEVSRGVTTQVNVPGDEAFNPIFSALIKLRDDLRAGDSAAISNTDIALVDSANDNLLNKWADIGARTNQLENTSSRLQDLKTNYAKLQSENEDVDIADTIMQLKMQENVYQAALDSGARIIQPTLMDFLK